MSERRYEPEQLKAAEEEWVSRVFSEIDELEADGMTPSRKDAQWQAGRKLQCELNVGRQLLLELSTSRELLLYIGADGRYGKRVADFLGVKR